MTWSVEAVEAVEAAIVRDVALPSRADEIEMTLFDPALSRGVGHDVSGRLVIVLPAQDSPPAFHTAALEFHPRRFVEVLHAVAEAQPHATLSCRLDIADPVEVRIVAHVVVSLFELQTRFHQIGSAIASLRGLFADGFAAGPTDETIAGLLGELLIIEASDDPIRTVSAWRVGPDDRYDFSAGNRRIEVKTTIGPLRSHHFTSRQLPPLHGLEVHVASIQLPRVARGTALNDVVARLRTRLDGAAYDKLALAVFETLGMSAEAVAEPQFDVVSGAHSIALIRAEDIPTPLQVPGVSDMHWSAFIDDTLADIDATIDGVLASLGDEP
jgi:hypothetical protein